MKAYRLAVVGAMDHKGWIREVSRSKVMIIGKGHLIVPKNKINIVM